MKKGDPIEVRRTDSTRWIRCRVELVTSDGGPGAVSADEGLPTGHGFFLDSRTGRMMLLLCKIGDQYQDVASGKVFEVRGEETGS